MSNTQYVFIERTKVPDRAKLQSVVDALKFPIELDPEFTPFGDLGFSPCTLRGKSGAGFEIFYEETEEIVEDDEEFRALADGRDCCISLVWRSSDEDLICVMGVSAAYAHAFDAVVSYEGDEPTPAADLIAQTRELLSTAETPSEVDTPKPPATDVSIESPSRIEVTVSGLVGGKVVTKKYEHGR